MNLCACGCNKKVVPPFEIVGFREICAKRLLMELRMLQNAPPDRLAMAAASTHDAGGVHLSNAMVGCIPFEVQ